MKIVLYGNFSVSYCSEVYHALSLEALGHEVIKLQETTITTEEVLRQSLQSDMLIWIHSHGFINQGNISMRTVLSELKAKNIPTVAYHLDLYYGIPSRFEEYKKHDYFNLEYIFLTDKKMVDWLNENTKSKAHWLPAGAFHEEAYIDFEYYDKAKIYDVVFIGSKGYHPEWLYRPQLIDWLQNTYGERFHHFGNDGIKLLRGMELNQVLAQTKVVVGDTFSPDFDYPMYWSDRIVDCISRGGFIIHPYIEGIKKMFVEDKEAVFYKYNDFIELKFKIDFFINHPDRREQIRIKGNQRALKEHLYTHRWQEIIKTIYGK